MRIARDRVGLRLLLVFDTPDAGYVGCYNQTEPWFPFRPLLESLKGSVCIWNLTRLSLGMADTTSKRNRR